jgi:beta-phosphoglucomutase-like phosphatase (HAD superfamily)
MKLEALIFDVDGTIAETEELHRQSFNATFQQFKLGWHWDPEIYTKLLQTTGGKERIVRYVADYVPDQRDVLDQLPALHRTKTKSYLDLLSKGALKLRPGIERLVYEARERDIKLAIATTSSPLNVKALLRSTLGEDSPNWFAISAGDVVTRKKPHPDVYFEALETLGVGPSHAVAFEDSTNGLRAARATGLAVVATPSLYLAEEDFTGATSVVSSLGEPDKPFRHLAGATFAQPWVDLVGLQALLDCSDDMRR